MAHRDDRRPAPGLGADVLAVLPERVQATVGRKVCGIVDLDLADDGRVEVHLVQPEGLAQLTIGDDFPSPFPGLV